MHLVVTFARLLAATSLALAALASPALACSCARNPTAQGIVASNVVVFTGVVEKSTTPAGRKMTVTTFKVTESFKGTQAGATMQVSHYSGPSATCGVEFAAGESYTLAAYATDKPDLFSTNLCSTWMFLPHVGLSERLSKEMRALRDHADAIKPQR